jgi:hypothetical protein
MAWLFGAVIGICAVFMLFNWGGLIGATIGHRRYSFAPPFLCGILSALALLIWPGYSLRWWALAPLFVDPSIGFCFIVLALQKVRKGF